MHIIDSEIVARKSGRKVSLYSGFRPTSTAIKILQGRMKRADPRVTTEQSFRVYEELLLIRDGHKTRIDELQARPCAFNPASYPLEIHHHQRATATQNQMPSIQVCLAPAQSMAAYQVHTVQPTTINFMGKVTLNPLLGIAKPDGERWFGGIQHLASEFEMETFWPSFIEAADSVSNLLRCLSLNTRGEIKSARDLRAADPEPALTWLVLDSSRCILKDSSLEEPLSHSEQSGTSESEISNDEEDPPILDEDYEIAELVDDIISLLYKHWSVSVDSKGISADTKLIQSLTKHIQKYFDKEIRSLAAVSESAASSTISESNRSDHSSMTITSQGSKRSRTEKSGHEADDDGENDEKSLKRPKQASLPAREKDYRGFACPYRKHNPRKYCVHDWPTCVLTPLRTVARVKGHLYRHHIIHQCQRCKRIFSSENEVDNHIETSQACEAVTDAGIIDGITRKMKERLQSRKKAYPGQTEAERWREIYRVLFPNVEEIPDPYFEPVQESADNNSLDTRELAEYEDLLHREVPRIVRQRIEGSINTKVGPIQESSINELVKIIQDAHAEISTRFRLNLNARVEPQTTTAEPTPKDHNDTLNQEFVATFSAAELSERTYQPHPQRSGNVGPVDPAPLAFGFPFHQTSSADSGFTTFGYKLDGSQESCQASTRSATGVDEEPGASLANRAEIVTKGNIEIRETKNSPSQINNQNNKRIDATSLKSSE